MKTLLVTMDFPPLLGGIANYYFNRVKKMPVDEVVVLMNKIENYKNIKLNNKIYFKNFFIKYFWPRWIILIWHIYRIAKKEKIQKIWVGQILPVGTAVYFISKILKIKYFITCHGNDLLRAEKNIRKFKLAKKILNSAEHIETNTEFTKNILINKYKINNKKIKIAYPENTLKKEMVDENEVKKLKEKYSLAGKKVLITVARLVESKGIDQVLRALPKVWKEIPDLVYLVVGDGDFSDQLLVISNQINPEKDKIIFVGPVPHLELPNYYALADVFILTPRKNPTGDTESFGIVYLEAQEFGLPIIAGDTGGIREICRNRAAPCSDFIFVDSEDINQIAEKIIKLLKS